MSEKTKEYSIFNRIIERIKGIFSKRKMIPEPQTFHYDQGVNIVVMKKSNFDNLKANMEKLDKKMKLDNGFISVDDLSDEEIEEMIQLYNDEIKELKQKIAAEKLENERLEREFKRKNENN